MSFPLKKLSLLSLTASAFFSTAGFADVADIEKNLSKLNVPEGFKVEIYAEVPDARQMALGQSTGTVFVGTRFENAYAVVDRNKDRKADEVITILDDLKVGNGVAMYQGNLYVAEQNRIARYAAPGFDLNLPFKDMREVIYEDLPDKAHHGWRYIDFGPDGKLYVTVGVPCNICGVDELEASIIRMNPDGSQAEVFAQGIRNSVGMDFQPDTDVLYFTDNGGDMLGDDIPSEELNAAPEKGLHFGFPYYVGGTTRPDDWQDKTPPQDITMPVAEFQAHSAGLGMKFYTGTQFPEDFKGDVIIAQHGSWNRTEPVGYQLVRVKFDENHQVIGHETFIDGWLVDGEAWGRPTDVLQLPDGSLLVSDDYNGVIYRVSYGEQDTANTSTIQAASTTTVENLMMPESAIAHPDGRVFVTEIGEFGKKGDGKITVINPDGSSATLADSLNDPKGIDLYNNALYVADVDRLVKVSLDGEVEVLVKAEDFPGKAVFLNDIEIDGNGTVYISDSGTDDGENSGIYQFSANGEITEILDDTAKIIRPNGLLMDGYNTMLVADFGNGDLYQLDIASATANKVNAGFGGADGLVRDTNGFLYISDWGNGKLWQLIEPKATPQLIREGFKAAADIALSSDGKHILVPDMKAGELVYVPIH